MPFVLDASSAFGLAAHDEPSDEALARRLVADEALVPALWAFEVGHAVRRAEQRSRLTPEEGLLAAEALAAMPVSVDPLDLERTLGPVLIVARAHRLSAYDAAYLELALRRGVPLVTADGRLRAAAQAAGVEVLA